MHRTVRSLAVLLALAAAPAAAQETPAAAPPDTAPPAAAPADVESVDGLIEALYASISGPAGERDWARLRTLFVPGGLLVPTTPRRDGTSSLRVLDVEGYIERVGPYFRQNPFYEVESGRRTERFGNVVNVMSAYESRRAPEEEPFTRGINSITLVHDGARWWVVSVAWDEHREGNEIPEGWSETD